MARHQRVRRVGVLLGSLTLLGALAAIGSGVSSASTPRAVKAAFCPYGWPGNSTVGCLPPNEPHVKGKGQVVVGFISAGDLNDHGYYESGVTTLDTYAKKYGWKTDIVGSVNPSAAATTVKNVCRQPGMDLVIVENADLGSASYSAAANPACAGIPFWTVTNPPPADIFPPQKYFYTAYDLVPPELYAAGVAAGLWMKAHHATIAGFVTGPELAFTDQAAIGIYVGMRSIIPNGKLLTSFTQSFDASAPAVTAAQAIIGKGAKIIYPYLGGATDAVASLANKDNVGVMTPGFEGCNLSSPHFDISVIFAPGAYLGYALALFAKGQMRTGIRHEFNIGLTPVPTMTICHPSGNEQSTLNGIMAKIGSGKINATKLVAESKYKP